MSLIIEDLMEVPASERLDFAMDIIRSLTCDNYYYQLHYQNLGFTYQQSVMLNLLVLRAGTVVSQQQLYEALYPIDSDVKIKVVHVFIKFIRNNFKKYNIDVTITTVTKVGYYISAEDAAKIAPPNVHDIPKIERTPHWMGVQPHEQKRAGDPWSEKDVQTLIEMLANGSDLWAIAEELGRSVRAIETRIRKIYGGTDSIGRFETDRYGYTNFVMNEKAFTTVAEFASRDAQCMPVG